jgi:hypothetical protein
MRLRDRPRLPIFPKDNRALKRVVLVVAGLAMGVGVASHAFAVSPADCASAALLSPAVEDHGERNLCLLENFPFKGSDGLTAAMQDVVAAPKKQAWEMAFGGQAAARPHLQARLQGWPGHTLVDASALPQGDAEFLRRLAKDTWSGLVALTDRASGLPIDNIRVTRDSVAIGDAHIGDYTSGTDIGLALVATVAAHDLGLVDRPQALERLQKMLDTLDGLETYQGFYFNFYDTTSLERTSNFVSFVDSAWLAAGLIVVRTSFPELAEHSTRLLNQSHFDFFYNSERQLISHGYYVNSQQRSPYDYGVLYTEARLGSLIAIGKGDIPDKSWFEMVRTFPADCAGQARVPQATHLKNVDGFEISAGYYEWEGLRYVPSWGGSMFEALMPTLLLDETAYAPTSLGMNGQVHAIVQRRYAVEQLGYPVWGMSPSATPTGDSYTEYGVRVLGSHGYLGGAVTPHASALALAVTPEAAIANLRTLAARYPIYGEYGFYDAVDPRSGTVAYEYLTLDQSMLFISVANHLTGGAVRKRFAGDPIIQKVLPMIAAEKFFDGREPLNTALALH